jgi:hypothetical protein
MFEDLSEGAQAAALEWMERALRRPPPWNPVVETWGAYVARLAADYRPEEEAAWQNILARVAAAQGEEPDA